MATTPSTREGVDFFASYQKGGKAPVNNKEIFELADALKTAKDHRKELDAEVKEVNTEIDRLNRELSNAMTDAELEKFTRNGSTFYLSSRLFASPASGMKDDLMQRLKDHGYGSIVVETVNANTLSSFVAEQARANEDEIPEWLAEVINSFEKISVGIRKA